MMLVNWSINLVYFILPRCPRYIKALNVNLVVYLPLTVILSVLMLNVILLILMLLYSNDDIMKYIIRNHAKSCCL